MKYSVVYKSNTGNTARLAQVIRDCLPSQGAVCFGGPGAEAGDADFIFAGFWTYKGDCDEDMTVFLKGLRGKKIFLFGTAGFGGSADYFDRILSNVSRNLDPSNTLAGSFMCQGRMPETVRRRYEAMPLGNPQRGTLLENFDRALTHPDPADLARLKEAVENVLGRKNV